MQISRRISCFSRPMHVLCGAALACALALVVGCQSQNTSYLMSESMAMEQLANEPIVSEAWMFGQIPGVKISTEHYHIYTTLRNPSYQRLVCKILEADHARFAKANPHTSVPGPLDCYVFGDRAQWEYFTRRRMSSNAAVYLQITAGGYCQEGVFAGYDLGREQTLSVIAHEAWHQYSWFAFKDRLPSWLEEGLATQNEAIDWQGTTPVFTPERNLRRFRALSEAIRTNHLYSIDDLTRMHAGQAIRKEAKDVDAFYAQVWSLTLFLEHSEYRNALADVIRRATEGQLSQVLKGQLGPGESSQFTEHWNSVAGPAYLRAFIAPDVPKFEAEYRKFIRDLTANWPPKLPK